MMRSAARTSSPGYLFVSLCQYSSGKEGGSSLFTKLSTPVVFDKAGELTDVKPVDGGKRKKRKNINIKKHLIDEDKSKKLVAHTFFYCNSPGCITYKTPTGYVTICW
jgi:hypothetical protein